MPAPSSVSRGLPVPVDAITRELAKLWRQGEGVMTRASMLNFVICCRGETALDRNTALMSELVQTHACRAIVLAAAPAMAAAPQVAAWVGAHCHISRAGAKQVCCEQITLLVRGDHGQLIPNLILSLLDSDLPFYLWWQPELPADPDPGLWTWVDRLFFDSATWADFGAGATRLQNLAAGGRPILCDLNWTRLLPFRFAMARLFAHPEHGRALADLTRAEITHAADAASTALLLAGWIATRLARVHRTTGSPPTFHASFTATPPPAAGTASPTRPIISCTLSGETLTCQFTAAPDGRSVRAVGTTAAGQTREEIVPGIASPKAAPPTPSGPPAARDRPDGSDAPDGTDGPDLLDLLDEELVSGSPHPAYREALAWAAMPLGERPLPLSRR